jgi:hypothetical protein
MRKMRENKTEAFKPDKITELVRHKSIDLSDQKCQKLNSYFENILPETMPEKYSSSVKFLPKMQHAKSEERTFWSKPR